MTNIDEKLFGMGLVSAAKPDVSGILRQQFIIPPFSVLNARDGAWQDRKRAWLRLGLEGELGRGMNLLKRSAMIAGAIGRLDTDDSEAVEAWKAASRGRSVSPGGSPMPAGDYSSKARGDGRGRRVVAVGRESTSTWTGMAADVDGYRVKEGKANSSVVSTTSIFDPVLCELLYRWFCPLGGQAIDPFAGGAVRGVVAHLLGRRYWGCDLREEQITANRNQSKRICPDNEPTWVIGDALNEISKAPEADFVLACPPYGDLEKYCDDPRDLSNMNLTEFRRVYTQIIRLTCERLKEDRFAAFVVGDYRDENGNYCNFPAGTINAFRKAGLHLYNEAILVTCITSLALRTKTFFDKSRKLGKGHQNVLIFVKGDGRRAADYMKSCEKE
jgi:hypothetical protein